MNKPWVLVFTTAMLAAAIVAALAREPPPVPYKLGTFEREGRLYLGLVLGDALAVDIERANAEFQESSPGTSVMIMPRDMTELIARYEPGGLRDRLAALARRASDARTRPADVRHVREVRTRPPIMYPTTILNAAVNFAEHAVEMGGVDSGAPATARQSLPGLWDRQAGDTRHNPYFFLKPSAAVIGDGDAIELPVGRDRIDWECELSVVVGRRARRVPVERVAEHIFGYTLQNDVSDRGGRGDARHGSDWLIGKGHDTFAPLGPYIVPAHFIRDPQKLAITFTLNGQVMQNSNTDRMTHTVREMLSFGSHILTLRPGDILAMGSPAGVGTARATPVYFKAGDVSVCSIEGIGTLTNPVVAAAEIPTARR